MMVMLDRMLSPLHDLIGLALENADKVRFLLRWVLMTWHSLLQGKPLRIGTGGEGVVSPGSLLTGTQDHCSQTMRPMPFRRLFGPGSTGCSASCARPSARMLAVFGLISNWVRNPDENAPEGNWALV